MEISVKDEKPDTTKNVFEINCFVTPLKVKSENSNR
jgi:hypothetical protein